GGRSKSFTSDPPRPSVLIVVDCSGGFGGFTCDWADALAATATTSAGADAASVMKRSQVRVRIGSPSGLRGDQAQLDAVVADADDEHEPLPLLERRPLEDGDAGRRLSDRDLVVAPRREDRRRDRQVLVSALDEELRLLEGDLLRAAVRDAEPHVE